MAGPSVLTEQELSAEAAIASRLDLTTSPQGEGRLVYGLIDPASGEPGLLTVAFEYALPSLGTANDRQAWAARWQILWSTEDRRYGGCSTPPLDTEDNWRIPGEAAVALKPVPAAASGVA